MDEFSFAMGMATAFCECVAARCKRCAFSQPLPPRWYDRLREPMEALVKKHGLKAYYEESLDLPEKERLCWWVIYAQDDALEEYLGIRNRGIHPVRQLAPFHLLLSYGMIEKSNI